MEPGTPNGQMLSPQLYLPLYAEIPVSPVVEDADFFVCLGLDSREHREEILVGKPRVASYAVSKVDGELAMTFFRG